MIGRRDFLSATGAAVAVAGAPPAATHAAAPGRWDRTAFEAILARPCRHRQVFASAGLEGGLVLHYMENSLQAYAEGFGEGPGTLHAAAVLYGRSLVVVLQDAMWTKYRLAALLSEPSEHRGLGGDAKAYVGRVEGMVNTLLHGGHADDDAAARNPYGTRLAPLVTRGASFFVCNNALRNFSVFVAAETPDTTATSIHDDLAEHLLGGAMIVPAGVAALNAAQEARFTLFQATLD
jgi:intracellular sulfur oxidation DsrE/DsrF family protein